MKLIQIDEEKCKKDSICIIECPFNLLRENESGIPEMIEGGETNCMVCGHCLAICPSGAVSLNGISPDSCDASQKNIIVDPQTMEALLKNRRSVRVYKDKSIERDTVGHLMDMIRWVPSSKNTQPLNWKLVDDRAKIREMAGLTVQWFEETNAFPDIVAAWKGGEDMILRNAPLIAIAHVAKNALNPTTDACIATASLELAAMSYGVGSFWTGFFMRAANNYTPLKAFLKLPENHAVFAGLALGYPKFKYHKIPNRQASKVTWM